MSTVRAFQIPPLQIPTERPTLMQTLSLGQIQHACDAIKRHLPELRDGSPLPEQYAAGLRNHLAQIRAEIDATLAALGQKGDA